MLPFKNPSYTFSQYNSFGIYNLLTIRLTCLINPVRTAYWEDNILKGLGLSFKH